MGLNEKQKRFAAEYIIDLNATQAAIRAGYSERTARQQASRLLSNVDVAAAVAAGQAKIDEKLEITAERVRDELAKIGFSNMLDYVKVGKDGDPYINLGKLTRDQAAAISEVTVEDFKDGRGEDARDVRRIKFKLHDKRSALVDLGKLIGAFRTPGDGADNPLHVTEVSDEQRVAALTVLAARAGRKGKSDGSTGDGGA